MKAGCALITPAGEKNFQRSEAKFNQQIHKLRHKNHKVQSHLDSNWNDNVDEIKTSWHRLRCFINSFVQVHESYSLKSIHNKEISFAVFKFLNMIQITDCVGILKLDVEKAVRLAEH